MRALLVLLPCAACNTLLGLDQASEVDAAVYACDPLPAFPPTPTILVPGCIDYTTDALHQVRAVAACGDGVNGFQITEGMPGSASMSAVKFGNDVAPKEAPRVSPAGDTMFVRNPVMGGLATFQLWQGSGIGNKWVQDNSFMLVNTFVPTAMDQISTPTAGAIDRHVVIHHVELSTGAETFVEFNETKVMGWTIVHTYNPEDLGVASFTDPYLSQDGLALWFVGKEMPAAPATLFATVRASLADSTFSKAIAVGSPADLRSPFLTGDCARLYMALGSDTSYVMH